MNNFALDYIVTRATGVQGPSPRQRDAGQFNHARWKDMGGRNTRGDPRSGTRCVTTLNIMVRPHPLFLSPPALNPFPVTPVHMTATTSPEFVIQRPRNEANAEFANP